MSRRDTIQYATDAGLLMIPGDPAKDFAPGFAVFDDSVPALRAFVLGRLRKENLRPVPPKAKCDAVTWESVFQGRPGLISSVLNSPIVDSMSALS